MSNNNKISQFTRDIVKALGGIYNIVGFNNCASKLRYDVKSIDLINEEELKKLGALEVQYIGNKHVQVKFGPKAEEINLEIKKAAAELKSEETEVTINPEFKNENKSAHLDCQTTNEDIVYAPCAGKVVNLDKLSENCFCDLGKGFAINIDDKKGKLKIYSPVKGKITTAYATKHSYGIQTANNLDVLVCVGVDSVKMNGLGFESHVELNSFVNCNDALVTVNLDKLRKQNIKTDIVVVVTDNKHKNKSIKLLSNKEIKKANEAFFEVK